MGDIKVLDAVERYIKGEMNPDERLQFENLRKTNAEIDQLVVEHTLFLQQMNRFGEWKKFRSSLNDVHTQLAEQGKIDSTRLKGKAKVIYLFNRYKRVAAIASVIAGVTTISLSALVRRSGFFLPFGSIFQRSYLSYTIMASSPPSHPASPCASGKSGTSFSSS